MELFPGFGPSTPRLASASASAAASAAASQAYHHHKHPKLFSITIVLHLVNYLDAEKMSALYVYFLVQECVYLFCSYYLMVIFSATMTL